jgi:hypothetical protein
MPLITSTTQLNKWKFGMGPWSDKRGGGNSNQPYIVSDIPGVEYNNPNQTFESVANGDLPVRSGPDFLLRNGFLAPMDALEDVSRLAQMFFDLKSPRGILFIAKENILSRSSVKTEASKGIGYGGGGVNQGIYTPLSTLGQALGGFAGLHLNKNGLDPTDPMSGVVEGSLFPGAGLNTYSQVMKDQKSDINQLNRLTTLQELISTNESSRNFNFIKNYNLNVGTDLITYGGGPGSILGIGNTSIKFADQRTGENNPLSQSDPIYFNVGSRWNSRTSASFISPLTGGASGKYEDYIGEVGSLIFNDGEPIVTADGGFTYAQNWDYRTTESGSLTPRGNLDQLQTTVKSTKTLGGQQEGGTRINFDNTISPSGSSNLYKSLTGVEFDNTYNDKNFFNVYDPNTTPGNTWPTNTPLQTSNGSKTLTQKQIIGKDNIRNGTSTSLYPSDFRKELYDTDGDNLESTQISKVISLSPNYRNKNIDTRLNQGQPGIQGGGLIGDTNKNVWNYGIKANELEALDKITAMPMYSSSGPDVSQAINDSVKFRVAAINNDPKKPGDAVYMHFRAFLDDFNDNYTATWTPVSYAGRGDKLYNYGGFGRSINLSFTVAAQSKAELIPMYKKLNYLASTLAPDYSANGYMRGNLVRLTVGGYLYEQPGFITALTYTVPQESSWEIGINEDGGSDSSVKELPHIIKVSGFTFTPIHTFLPQKPNNANNPDSRFISLSNGVGSNYNDTYKKYKPTGTTDGDNNIAT